MSPAPKVTDLCQGYTLLYIMGSKRTGGSVLFCRSSSDSTQIIKRSRTRVYVTQFSSTAFLGISFHSLIEEVPFTGLRWRLIHLRFV